MSPPGAPPSAASPHVAPQPSYSHRSNVLDPSRLAPEDAFNAYSPPKRGRAGSPLGASASSSSLRVPGDVRRKRNRDRRRSNSRRRKRPWKKLLWVTHPYPDNYTDEETFLDHLQWNPRLQPYEFWPLVADSQVIVQHAASVIIFVCCFTVIFNERISPLTVVSYGSLATVFGWFLWDIWVGQEEANKATTEVVDEPAEEASITSSSSKSSPTGNSQRCDQHASELLLHSANAIPTRKPSAILSVTSLHSQVPYVAPTPDSYPPVDSSFPPYGEPVSSLSPRNQQRVATFKSALLIYCALLGLSPILKSLTESTSEDSIWALSTWLMCINVFFFDYGGEPGVKFPASLSTNAAVMASTVLASRLPSTTHVFSLTLFSIEVFGLFPVFRRYLRHISWKGNMALTLFLVMSASGGLGVTISGGGWKAAIAGMILGSILTALVMGMCSWWLLGLQKYKNEIHGPWDPARPVIRRRWD